MGHRWTQINFVQEAPHRWVQDTSITATDVLRLPVDCVLAGQQLQRDRYWEFEVHKPRVRVSDVATAMRGPKGRLSGASPSFTTKTGLRGYD